jgi:hypothetical protein
MHEYKVDVERDGRWWMVHVSDITGITVPGVGDVAQKAAEITRLQAPSEYAKVMTREGVPVRDIAELLDVSPQRVSQIANSSYEK